MNVRFAESCREKPLELLPEEDPIRLASINDGRTQKEMLLPCEKDIFIGVFFDGTNNNKYRDTPGFSQSNVARLYEVYPGTPAAQTAPTFKPKVNADGSTTARPVFPDQAFKAAHIPAEDFPYYRKIYVPGVGTPMPDVGDSGTGMSRTGGLVAALMGQIRLDWATLQLLNQIHAAVFKAPLAATVDMRKVWRQGNAAAQRKWLTAPIPAAALLGPLVADQLDKLREAIGSYEPAEFESLVCDYRQRLEADVKAYGRNKPVLRKIRLSVFGFSRGAAEARAWVNMVTERFGSSVAGVALQIDFLGIFDTVASVGLAQSTPTFNGHASWADDRYMSIPASVKRCVHLVAAHEVRGSFPLDSVCQGNSLPANCKEIVYPGVHSDVGGGYPPGDQGRALGQGAAGDKFKLSQISLAQMYREARMAAVPLAPRSAMRPSEVESFAIAPQLREDFNAYIAATRSGSVPPTNGKGVPSFARMFPTETQPREELFRVMRRHYGILLRWRKSMMNRPGGIAGLPCMQQATSDSKYQDMEDFRGAEEELRKEIVFLQSTDPQKFESLDDPLQAGMNIGSVVAAAGVLPLLAMMLLKERVQDVMREKQRQWDTWLQDEWSSHTPDALPPAAERLFATYVHDSRAWFKPMWQSDGSGLGPNDEDWFTFGGREQERQKRLQAQQQIVAAPPHNSPAARAQALQEIQRLQQPGEPLIRGGREPYRLWGYLRHRRIYQAGRLRDPGYASLQEAVARDEQARLTQRQCDELTAQENARHEAEVQRLSDNNRRVLTENKLSNEQQREYTDGTRQQIARERQQHQEIIADIEARRGRAVSPL